MALYTASGRRRIMPPLVFGLGVFWHLLRHGRRYDVVDTCAFPYFSLLAAALVRRLGGYRLVVSWFEVWSASYWREYLGGVGGRVGMLVQRLCALVPQRAMCFSRLHADRLREEGLRGEVQVLRGLYTGSAGIAAPSPADPVVVFAGRMIPEKRAPDAVAGVAAALARVEGLRGTFYGDGPEREQVLAAIARADADGALTAPGFVPAEQIDEALTHALCMLLPSRREGYGMVVVEAAARGTPSIVVAGPDNAATELIEDGVNGFVARSSEPEVIASAIEEINRSGMPLRESTAAWFSANARRLSLESSLDVVLASYDSAAA
jgi:glycosyltransferase involved in cell wall biosynthesis